MVFVFKRVNKKAVSYREKQLTELVVSIRAAIGCIALSFVQPGALHLGPPRLCD